MEINELIKEIDVLKEENLHLKCEIQNLEILIENQNSDMKLKAKAAIQRKKEARILAYKKKIIEIIEENKKITTKELIERLGINNKTFYNLKLNEFFNNRHYFHDGDGI